MQSIRTQSKEIDRRLAQIEANERRLVAYELRKAESETDVLIAEARRCKWLRRQAN